jgi:hypothetical protein
MPSFLNAANPLNAACPLNRGLVTRYVYLPGHGGAEWRDIVRSHPVALSDGGFFDGSPRLGNGWQETGSFLTFPSQRPGGWGSLNFNRDAARSSAVASNYTFAPVGSRSYFAWIYPTRGSGEQVIATTLVNLNSGGTEIINARLGQSSGQKFFTTDSGSVARYSTSTIPDNQWSHVGFSWDSASSVLRIYLNGRLDATHTSITMSTLTSTNFLRYGWATSSTPMFCGGQDDICVFSRFVDSDEYTALYDDSRSGHPLTLNWYDESYLSAFGKRPAPYTAPSIFPVWLTV